MGWDEVKKLHNRFTKYPLDLLYYIADYKMHGKESYVYRIKRIRDMIYDAVDISMFDDDLIVGTFVNHLERGNIGKAIAARYEQQDKNTYSDMRDLSDIIRSPLVRNPTPWFKKILMDEYFIRLGAMTGNGYDTLYILAKCGIPADHIFKAMNKDSSYIIQGMNGMLSINKNRFFTRDWDAGIFDLDTPGLRLNSGGGMDPYKLTQRIELTCPSIIAINGFHIDPRDEDYHLTIVTPRSEYDIFNTSDVPSIYATVSIRDNLRKKIDSVAYIGNINGTAGLGVSCTLYIIGDAGTSLIGGNGITLIGRLYEYRGV